jgi:predicted MFS family arabinose efflux permease
MRHLFAALLLDGLMLGFVASYSSHLIPEHLRSPLHVGIMLMLNGVGAILGGYFSGYLSDKVTPPQLGVLGFMFIILSLLLTLLANYLSLETIGYPCFLGFLWGVCVYFLEGWIFVCCAKVYEGRIETFAIVKQVHSISFIIFQIYMIIVSNQINSVAYLLALIILSLIALISSKQMQEIAPLDKHD